MGKETEDVGDSLSNFKVILNHDEIKDFFSSPKGPKSLELLGNPLPALSTIILGSRNQRGRAT